MHDSRIKEKLFLDLSISLIYQLFRYTDERFTPPGTSAPRRADTHNYGCRSEGFLKALKEAGLPVVPRVVRHGPWSEAWGHAAVAQLLRSVRKFDAIFCGSDQIARGCADAMRESGVRVPEDVALVGYANWEIIAAATRPPLSTLDMNLRELGAQAGSLLVGLIGGQAGGGGRLLVSPKLVIRDSCGATRAVSTRTATKPARKNRRRPVRQVRFGLKK